MKHAFIHHTAFRILAPVLMGTMAYLLIILFSNEVSQISLLFESQELYVCIVTAVAIMELDRWVLIALDQATDHLLEWKRLLLMLGICSAMGVLLSYTLLYFYFTLWVGFAPSNVDLWIFTNIFWSIAFLHFVLYLGHMLLHKENKLKLVAIEQAKEALHNEFMDFRNDINPELLFSSLEQLLSLVDHHPDRADDLIDHLSAVYRYMLAHRQTELVSFDEEKRATEVLVGLFDQLPQYHVTLAVDGCDPNSQIVPSTLLSIAERIVKRTIASAENPVAITISCQGEYLILAYQANDRLTINDTLLIPQKTQRVYGVYIDKPLIEVKTDHESFVKIPILKLEQNTL